MAWNDIFTGAPAIEAANNQRAFYDASRGQFANSINSGLANSTRNIQDNFGAGRDVLRGTYGDATSAVGQGYGDAQGYLGSGRTDALGRLDAAGAAFTPLSELAGKYGGATSLALDALGTGGAEGTARARSAFQAGPAYDWNLTQGIEAVNRGRNARGMANSGNTDVDIQKYGAGLASNEYDKWLNNLIGFTNPELSATSGAATGQAAANTNAANIESQYGQNAANLATGRAGMLSDLASRYGTNTNASLQGEGTALAGLNTGAARDWNAANSSLVQPYGRTYSDEAQAQLNGNANAWNLGIQGARLAASLATGMPMGGGGGNLSAGSYGGPVGGSSYSIGYGGQNMPVFG